MKAVLRRFKSGFTIVELLIVVVVIAILAAITVVGYNGISRQAQDASLKSELSTIAKQLNMLQIEAGNYPLSLDSVKVGGNYNFNYVSNGTVFCLSGTSGAVAGKTLRITNSGVIEDGACAVELADTMKDFTSVMCKSLDTYTGVNSGAIVTLSDDRGGVERQYDVAKLADGKCWMLENLKLGSADHSIVLTPGDSNVGDDFILPQMVGAGSTTLYDDAQVAGPVPGDTGEGSTNYGYLYNFAAATAGETRTSLAGGAAEAPYSVCPRGWRLPSGGYGISANDFAILDQAFGGAGVTNIDNPAWLTTGWLSGGIFRGVLSGYYSGSFSYQQNRGQFWSRTVTTSTPTLAMILNLGETYMYIGASGDRVLGRSIRCIMY